MLAFDQTGSGVPLVLLHAFPLNRRMWQRHLPVLGTVCHPIAFDLPGFGASPAADDSISMADMARSVLQTLDGLNIKDKAIFAGLSMGGYVLFQLLRLQPERFRGVVLISTRAAADSEEGRAKRFKLIERVTQDGIPSLVETMRPALLGSTTLQTRPDVVKTTDDLMREARVPGVVSALKAMSARPDSTLVLKTISCPSFIISGAEDTVVPNLEMKGMAAEIPNSEFVTLERAGHLLNVEQPEQFEQRLVDFLKRTVI